MKTHTKKLVCSLLLTFAFAFFAISVGLFLPNKSIANAASNTISVDFLGNLEWTETDNAIGYQWTYKIGDKTSIEYGTQSNSVKVGKVLDEAVAFAKDSGASSASVTFSVTPVLSDSLGETFSYTHSFDKYIDYDYTTHDISEEEDWYVNKSNVAEGTTKFTSGAGRNTDNAFWKNDILTFGLYSTLSSTYKIAVGGTNVTANSANYLIDTDFKMYASTKSGAVVGGDSIGNGSTFALSQNNYCSLAVFDTYAIDGTNLGETVYFSSGILSDNELTTRTERSRLFTLEEIETARTAGTYFGWEDGVGGDGKVKLFFNVGVDTTDNQAATYTVAGYNAGESSVSANVDFLGNLEIDGLNADKYYWSYTIDEKTSETFLSSGSKIFAGKALLESANAAKQESLTEASVTFNVAPYYSFGQPFESISFTHSFVEYIDYDYTTHDISEVNSNITSGKNTTMNSSSNRNTENGFWKNDILTFGLHYDGTATPIWMISVGGETSNLHSNNSNYSLTISANGSSGWRVNLKGSDLYMTGSGNGAMAKEEDQYMSLAVFDTYDIAGNIIGETVYLSSATKNTNGDLIVNNERTLFCDSNTITEATQAGYHSGWEEEGDGKVVVGFNEYNDTSKAWLFPATVEEESSVSANVDFLGNLTFDAVDGAIGYFVTYTIDGQDPVEMVTADNRLFVGDAILEAAKNSTGESASVRFDIVPYYGNAIGDKALSYVYTFTEYIDFNYTTHDISSVNANINKRVTLNSGANRTTSNGFYKNDIVTFGLYSNASSSATPVYQISIGGSAFSTDKSNYYFTLYTNGTSGWRVVMDGSTEKIMKNIIGDGKLPIDNEHFCSLAVFDTYDLNGNVKGETIYLSTATKGVNGELVVNNEKSLFFSSSDIETATNSQKYFGWENGKGDLRLAVYGNDQEYAYVMPGVDNTEKDSALKAASVTLDGKIGLNLYMDFEDIIKENLEYAKIKISYNGTSTLEDIPEPETTGQMQGLYKYTVYLPAKEIDTNITTELVLFGVETGEKAVYSIRDYIQAVEKGGASVYGDKHYNLVVAMKDYCDAVKGYFDLNSTWTASDTVNAVELTDLGDNIATVSGLELDETVENVAVSLFTEEDTTIRLYVKATSIPTITVNGNPVSVSTLSSANGYYYVDVENISGFDLSAKYTFTINEDVMVECTALSYAYSVLSSSAKDDAELANVVKALYVYSEEANAYRAQ